MSYNDTIYSEQQYDIIEEVCIEHAVFAWVEEYGLDEHDFIKWLSDLGVTFQRIISPDKYLYPYMERFCKEQQDLDNDTAKV